MVDGDITEEKWIEFVTNKTQILDILNLQFTNFWTDVQHAMYLYYIRNAEPKSAVERVAVLLGEEGTAVERIELQPDFRRWLTRKERLGIEEYTQRFLFGGYHEGLQM